MEHLTQGGRESKETISLPPGCSGVCEKCGGVNDASENNFQCPPCFLSWFGKPSGAPAVIQTEYVGRGKVKTTVNHLKDIKSRKMADDGRGVVREKPRRTYLIGG